MASLDAADILSGLLGESGANLESGIEEYTSLFATSTSSPHLAVASPSTTRSTSESTTSESTTSESTTSEPTTSESTSSTTSESTSSTTSESTTSESSLLSSSAQQLSDVSQLPLEAGHEETAATASSSTWTDGEKGDEPALSIDDKINELLFCVDDDDDDTVGDQATRGKPAVERSQLQQRYEAILCGVEQAVAAVEGYFGAAAGRSGEALQRLGDDGASPQIARLVRGTLASSIARILQAGLVPPSRLPLRKPYSLWSLWREHTKHSSYRSGLAGIVLNRAIRSLHDNYRVCDAHQKFRSLICAGLNEHMLHKWIVAFVDDNQRVIKERYQSGSPLCDATFCALLERELQRLAHLPFNLSLDFEFKRSLQRSTERSLVN